MVDAIFDCLGRSLTSLSPLVCCHSVEFLCAWSRFPVAAPFSAAVRHARHLGAGSSFRHLGHALSDVVPPYRPPVGRTLSDTCSPVRCASACPCDVRGGGPLAVPPPPGWPLPSPTPSSPPRLLLMLLLLLLAFRCHGGGLSMLVRSSWQWRSQQDRQKRQET